MIAYEDYKQTGFSDIGCIPSTWDLGVIKNKFEVVCGATPSENDINWGGNIPWVGPADMPMFGNIGEGKRSLTELGYNSCGTTLVPKDSIVLSTRAPIGKICIALNDLCTNQGCKCLVPKNDTNPKFYAYYLFAILERLQQDGTGTTFKELSTSKLKEEPIPILPIEVQSSIVSFLDDKTRMIDNLIEEAKATIEEYKSWKASIIYEAVTKGLDKNVEMKDSGVKWLPQIPAHWDIRRIASIYKESNETGGENLPVLLISIHTGISDREVSDEERDRKVLYSEDKSLYKVVHPNYLAYNMMRAWQGGFGAATVDGLVSPAYVVAKPISKVNSSYIENVLRTPNAVEHMRGLSYGVADFRLRLYWPYFKSIKVPFPPYEEQVSIVKYIKEQNEKLDSLISEKQSLISDLESYKKSLIFETVTGKRKVV